MTGHGNTGYAGYFINTDTSTNQNYGVSGYVSSTATTGSNPAGVYGEGDCADCAGVDGFSATTTRRRLVRRHYRRVCLQQQQRRGRRHLRHDHRPRQHRLCRLLHQHRHEQQQQLRRLWQDATAPAATRPVSIGECDSTNCTGGVYGISTNNAGVGGSGVTGVYGAGTWIGTSGSSTSTARASAFRASSPASPTPAMPAISITPRPAAGPGISPTPPRPAARTAVVEYIHELPSMAEDMLDVTTSNSAMHLSVDQYGNVSFEHYHLLLSDGTATQQDALSTNSCAPLSNHRRRQRLQRQHLSSSPTAAAMFK